MIESFDEIAGNIRRGYSIGYVPTNTNQDGGYRRVKVTVVGAGPQQPQCSDTRWLSVV